MRFLRNYEQKYRKPFSLAIFFLMLEAIGDLMQPTIMARIIDVGVTGGDMIYVRNMGGFMLLITALGAGAAVSRNIISSNVSQRFGTELRGDLFKQIQSFSFDNIDRFETASLVTRLTNDVTQVQVFVHGMMRIFVKAPLLCIGSIIMAFLLNARMALLLVAIVPIIGLLIYLSVRIGYPHFRKVQRMLDGVNSVMREYLAGVRVVKAFNRFSYETKRFHKSNTDLAGSAMKAMRVMAVFTPGITLTVNLGIVALMWLGGFRVNTGGMQVGQIIAFTNYMTQILFSLMMISWVFNMFVRARASADRIDEVMNEKNTMAIKADPADLMENAGRIEFRDVGFSYTGASGEPVLQNISFSLEPGETLGIIGSTGAGKSTLINLIPRFYDVDTGTVMVNGRDVRDVDPQELRDRISVVAQKTVLFTGTISDNICWGRDNAAQGEIVSAAKAAQAHDFVSTFKEGYDTWLGQGGVNLSGGQKQRVSIARALIRQPEILILDDCTSAVDGATEAKIRQGLRAYGKGLTCIIIAQRITSVIDTDKILVLDNGRAAGLGSHEYLMQTCGIYREIYRSQIGKEGIPDVTNATA